MSLTVSKIRNIVVGGHGSCGKTTLLDGILFLTKKVNRHGSVDEGNSILDFEPEERQRKMSIRLSIAPVSFDEHKINLIDTPGYADFIGEVYSGINAADAALIVVDASSGVQVQTDKVWNATSHLPRAFFINKLDKSKTSYRKALQNIKEFYPNIHLAPVILPIGEAENLKGVINLVNMKAYYPMDEDIEIKEIPEDMKETAEEYRIEFMESAAEGDDEALETYLEEGTLTRDQLINAFKKGFYNGEVIPVFTGSAKMLIGLQSLLKDIVEFFPSPKSINSIKVNKDDKVESISPEPDSDPVVYVFKTTADPYVGRLSFVRLFTGKVLPNSQLYNANSKRKERIGHIFEVYGKEQRELSEISCGDIGVIPKLTDTETGNTLCSENFVVTYQAKPLPDPVYSVAVEPKTKGDEEKLSSSLSKLSEEDPTLVVSRDPESKQIIVSGMGDLHIDVLLETMKRKFEVDATTSEPKIPYRETIKSSTKAQGKYKRQSGGRGQYGDVWIEIEPLERGSGFVFEDKITGGVVPKNYIPSVEKGIKETMEQGIIAGYPVIDVKVTLYDGSHHSVDSSDMAFKIAGSMAFKNAITGAKPTILEPIMNVEVIVPEKYMGDVMGQLSSKRGKIVGTVARGKYEVIQAQVPLGEMTQYATEIRSVTHGEGNFSMEFSHYGEAPYDIQQKIIEQAKREEEEAEN